MNYISIKKKERASPSLPLGLLRIAVGVLGGHVARVETASSSHGPGLPGSWDHRACSATETCDSDHTLKSHVALHGLAEQAPDPDPPPASAGFVHIHHPTPGAEVPPPPACSATQFSIHKEETAEKNWPTSTTYIGDRPYARWRGHRTYVVRKLAAPMLSGSLKKIF